MRTVLGNVEIRWQAYAVLEERGRIIEKASLMAELGQVGAENGWCVLWGDSLGEDRMCVVIAPVTEGTVPLVLVLEDQLAFGFDNHIVAIDCKSGQRVVDKELESPVRGLLQVKAPGLVIVVYETGVVAFDDEWNTAWELSTDLIDQVRQSEHAMHLTFFDEAPKTISILNGKVV